MKPNFNAGDGIKIQNGISTEIAVSKTVRSKISTRANPCRSNMKSSSSDSLYFNLTHQYTRYNRESCREMYIQYKYIIKNCRCIGVRAYNYEGLKGNIIKFLEFFRIF